MGFKMVIEQIFEENRPITYMTGKISLTEMLFQMIFEVTGRCNWSFQGAKIAVFQNIVVNI